jgi:predicted O-linked N-acetylglucosamine transferase (SPINDLY family)
VAFVNNQGPLDIQLQRALALHQAGRLEEAQFLYEQILFVQPRHFDALHLSGVLASNANDPQRALDFLDRALDVDPNNAPAHFNRGAVLQQMKQRDAAIASYDRSIAIDPQLADAFCNRAVLQTELKLLPAALASCNQAIALRPNFAEAYYNRGNVYRELNSRPAAIDSYDAAIAIRSNYPEALFNRGNVLAELKEWDAALASYTEAVAVRSGYAVAHVHRGNVFRELNQWEAALASYRQADALDPRLEFLAGQLLHAQMRICDWTDVETRWARLAERILNDESAANPFAVLALCDSAAIQKKAAQIWIREKCAPDPSLGPIPRRALRDRIHVGYFSADFHDHATSYLIGELFELHDRSRFRITAFSFGPNSGSEMRSRLMAACDEFIDVGAQPDSEIASLARRLEVDIAVDLKGYTESNRAGIYAHRAAPLQVNYLGYPGTLGADYMDYLIADRTLIPQESLSGYAEHIAYLPHSYQANDARRKVSDRAFTRAQLGLPEAGFVFCCFNNNYKITPAVFDRWMRILERVSGSVLWLLEDNPAAAANLRREARRRNVSAERLVFAPRMDLPQHLARHGAADLFIDTWPCNAHTTASDALWTGLPLITHAGESFASRVAASLLTALELPELIASTLDQYEESAVALATDPPRLAAIKQKLAQSRSTAPLFDSPRFARDLERLYSAMVRRYHEGLPPGNIMVESR